MNTSALAGWGMNFTIVLPLAPAKEAVILTEACAVDLATAVATFPEAGVTLLMVVPLGAVNVTAVPSGTAGEMVAVKLTRSLLLFSAIFFDAVSDMV
ncbi:MAG: hypothetical protein CXR31_07135 [Geobacter sp.]|nr:MAG: hypothetical protein CXR31_07135 [Geobacter sp.]